MHKNKKTYERCYICDYRGDFVENVSSIYADSLSDFAMPSDKAFVFIDKEGKPVCSSCVAISMDALSEFDPPEWMADDLGWLYGRRMPDKEPLTVQPKCGTHISKKKNGETIDGEEITVPELQGAGK